MLDEELLRIDTNYYACKNSSMLYCFTLFGDIAESVGGDCTSARVTDCENDWYKSADEIWSTHDQCMMMADER